MVLSVGHTLLSYEHILLFIIGDCGTHIIELETHSTVFIVSPRSKLLCKEHNYTKHILLPLYITTHVVLCRQ